MTTVTEEAAAGLDETVLCPHCLKENDPAAHFCRHCVTPLTVHAATDPLKSIFAEVDTLSKGAASPRSVVVVIGMILLLGPWLAGAAGVILALAGILGMREATDLGVLAAGLAFHNPFGLLLSFVPLILLIRMARHVHLLAKESTLEEPLPPEWEAGEWEVLEEGNAPGDQERT